MANVAYIDTAPGSDWKRGPDPAISKRVERLRQRRKRIVAQAGRVLAYRSVGGESTVVKRLEKLARLHAEYCSAGSEIIALELL